MRRRKITPEVILKSTLTFIFGAAVGFGSFHLVGLIRSRVVFAESPNSSGFPKTLDEIRKEASQDFFKIYKPAGPENKSIQYFYTTKPTSQNELTETIEPAKNTEEPKNIEEAKEENAAESELEDLAEDML